MFGVPGQPSLGAKMRWQKLGGCEAAISDSGQWASALGSPGPGQGQHPEEGGATVSQALALLQGQGAACSWRPATEGCLGLRGSVGQAGAMAPWGPGGSSPLPMTFPQASQSTEVCSRGGGGVSQCPSRERGKTPGPELKYLFRNGFYVYLSREEF